MNNSLGCRLNNCLFGLLAPLTLTMGPETAQALLFN